MNLKLGKLLQKFLLSCGRSLFSAFKSSVKVIWVRPLTGLPESFSSLKELCYQYVKAGDVVHFV